MRSPELHHSQSVCYWVWYDTLFCVQPYILESILIELIEGTYLGSLWLLVEAVVVAVIIVVVVAVVVIVVMVEGGCRRY